MEFKLSVESSIHDETQEINIDGFLNLSTVCDDVTLYNALTHSLANIGQMWDQRWDEIIPLHLTVDGHKIDISRPSQDSAVWLWELSQLVMFLDADSTGTPAGAYLAYLDSTGWKWTNFDDIEGWADDYVNASDGFAEYARERFEDEVPEAVVNHVDWDAVGEEIMQNYTEYTWGTESYYFNA